MLQIKTNFFFSLKVVGWCEIVAIKWSFNPGKFVICEDSGRVSSLDITKVANWTICQFCLYLSLQRD